MSRTRLIAVLSLLAVVLAAGAIVGALRSGSEPRVPLLPRCARPAHTIPRPLELPKGLPLPAGTVFTGVDRKYRDSPVVAGRIPLGLHAASAFLTRRLPAVGYPISSGEQELGYEAEGDYAGHGVSGRFKLRVLFQCRGATRLWISVRHAG